MDRTRKEAMVFLIINILSAAAGRLFSERSLYLSTGRPKMQRKMQRLHRYNADRSALRQPSAGPAPWEVSGRSGAGPVLQIRQSMVKKKEVI
jgi:hypothetical protein